MRRAFSAAAVVSLALALGACSSANGETAKPPGSSAPQTTVTSTPNPAYDKGDAVSITADGFAPRWLIADVGQRVTFTNTTPTEQQIVFDNAREPNGAFVQSPVIPPGGTWVWNAATFASFAYHSPNLPGVDGRIQVTPPAEP